MAWKSLPLSKSPILLNLLYLCCCLVSEVRTQRPTPAAAAGAGGYLDIRRDGSYRYAYATGDVGRHYHQAAASPDNTVTGRYGERDPKSGGIRETSYTAGRNGFRARGPHIARKMSLTQNRIPYNPPVSPNSPRYNPTYSTYNDPNNDPTYEFGFRSPDHSRQEASNSKGNVEGSYSYIDDVGVRHTVAYEAGAKTGFHVKTPFPDSDRISGALFFRKPNKGGKGFRGHSAIEQNTDGSFRFTATGPDQKHTETSDKNGNRRGTYTYLDPKGVQRTTEYIAGPNIGYKVINTKLSTQFSQAYPFLPPSFLIPPIEAVGNLPNTESFNTAESGNGLKPSRPTQQLSAEKTDEDYEDKPTDPDADDGNDSSSSESSPDTFLNGNDNSGNTGFQKPSRPRPGGGGGGGFPSSGNKPQSTGNSGEGSDGGGTDEDLFGSTGDKPSGGDSSGQVDNGFGSVDGDGTPTGGDNSDVFGGGGNKRPGLGGGGNSDVFGGGGNKRPGLGGGGFGGDKFGQDNKRPGGGGFGDGFGSGNKRPGSGGGSGFNKPVDNFGQTSDEGPVSTGGGDDQNEDLFTPTSKPDKRPSGGSRPSSFRPPSTSRPSGGRPPYRPSPARPPPPPTDIRPPYPASFRPDEDDAIFGPSDQDTKFGSNDKPAGKPSGGDNFDDIFGAPRPDSGPFSPIDFSRPITNPDLGPVRAPKRPSASRPTSRPTSKPTGRPGKPAKPSGFGPDNNQFGGGEAGNCCNNRGNVKPFESPPSGDHAGSYSHTRDSTYDQQTAQNFVRERFFSFPPGVAVRAHVQSLDIVPYGSRMPNPGLAIDRPTSSTRRQRESNPEKTQASVEK